MTSAEIENKIHFQKEKIEVLEKELNSEKEELDSLYMDFNDKLSEEKSELCQKLTNTLLENERMEQELKARQSA